MWTFEEWKMFWEMLNSMPEFRFGEKPVAESVTFDGISNGKRNTEKQASLYDAMLAEIYAERDGEKARVRNRRCADRKHKVLPEERKHREEMRKDRMFGYYYNENCPKVMFAPDSLPIKNRKYAEGDRIAREDWDKEKKNHAEQMRKIRRIDDMVEGISEWLEEVDDWFMDDDICRWMYEDGGLCDGAESRIEERRLYKDEIDGYMSESRKMYADEEYIRPVFDMGIRADLYLKSLANY